MKSDLLNRYAALRAADWLTAGDITLRELSRTFDFHHKQARKFTCEELRAMIQQIAARQAGRCAKCSAKLLPELETTFCLACHETA